MDEEAGIWVESQVDAKTGAPKVIVRWNAESGEMTPSEARIHALSFLAAADAAESDAFIVRFFTSELGSTPEMAGQVLGLFRTYRDMAKED